MSTSRPIEILLVEDSPSDRLIAVEALAGARVRNNLHTVEDGVEAMAFLRHTGKYASAPRPDVILLDLNLPRKDGREVLAEIKGDARFKLIPVIVLTTSQADEDVSKVYGLNANCMLNKPVEFSAFVEAIRSLEKFWFEVVTLPPQMFHHPALTEESEIETASTGPGVMPGIIRVLLVEDNPADVLLFRADLEDSVSPTFHVTNVERLADAEILLSRPGFDVVISDLKLPDGLGLETVMRLRDAAPTLPVIVLTSLDNEQLGVAAMQEGADDYLVKMPGNGKPLIRAVRYAIERGRLEARLRQAQRLQAVGQLAGGVAHDFNNLLTVISGNIGLLEKKGEVDYELQEALQEISMAVSRASGLTRQLLTFSRQQPVRKQWLDLSKVAGDLHKILSRVIGEHVQMELQLAGDLPPILADTGMMEQVMMNLAVNARDAMPGGGKLTVRTSSGDFTEIEARHIPNAKPGPFVCLSIGDTGQGMSPELMARIFEPFFTTKEQGKGTGLGLATVHGIVQQHDGAIRVESQPGKGTRFDVFFPAGGPVLESTIQDEGSSKTIVSGSETILIVEDEEALRQVLEKLFEHLGFKPMLAANGPEALAIWKERHDEIALVFTDVVMPSGMTGVDLIKALQQDRPALKYIYASGYSIEFARNQETFVEGENFLQKPYSLARLGQIVRRKLDEPVSK